MTFLDDFYIWQPQWCIDCANADQLILTEEHWQIIHLIRQFFATYHNNPNMRAIINYAKTNNVLLTSKHITELFPEGLAQQANRYAGLPGSSICL